MKVFDGTNLLSITKSFIKILEFSPNQFIGELKLYIVRNLLDLKNATSHLEKFLDQCNTSKSKLISLNNLQIDRVMFFHKTSLIDNGEFIKTNGLLDLDNLLISESPLSKYLKDKGIEFFYKEKVPWIQINGRSQPLKDLECNKVRSYKPRIVARLTKPSTQIAKNTEGITGYIFLDDAINDQTYQHIYKVPEFLVDLDYCTGLSIADNWKNSSTPVILKCEVDIESWYTPKDLLEKFSSYEKSYQILTQGFSYLLENYAKRFFTNTNLYDKGFYSFISYGSGIPSNRIKEIIHY